MDGLDPEEEVEVRLSPGDSRQEEALAAAVGSVLWRAGESNVTIPTTNPHHNLTPRLERCLLCL